MLCCCQYKSPLPTIESNLQYNSRPMKMFISCCPVVPLLEITLWTQLKRRKLLYAFSKKYITKSYFVHPLVGLGRLPGLLFVQLPNGPVRKTMTREELWAPFHKGLLSNGLTVTTARKRIQKTLRDRPHCRNTKGLWDGRPLGHDACAVTGAEFRDLFQAPAWGSMRSGRRPPPCLETHRHRCRKGLFLPRTEHIALPSLW